MLPSPNQRMKTGTQASEGIGISALASGRTKCSTGRKRPISTPKRQSDRDSEDKADTARDRASRRHEANMVPSRSDVDERMRHGAERRHQGGREIPLRAAAS